MEQIIILLWVLIAICYCGFGLHFVFAMDMHDSLKDTKIPKEKKVATFIIFIFFIF